MPQKEGDMNLFFRCVGSIKFGEEAENSEREWQLK